MAGNEDQPTPVGLLVGGDEGQVIAADPPPMRRGSENFKALLTDNLFKDAKNSILTVVFGSALVYVALRTVQYVFFNARWEVIFGIGREVDGVVQTPSLVRAYMLGPSFSNTGLSESTIWIGVYLAVIAFGLGLGMARDPELEKPSPLRRVGIVLPPILGIAIILAMTRTILPTVLTLIAVAALLAANAVGPKMPAAIKDRQYLVVFLLLILSFMALTGFAFKSYQPLGVKLPPIFPDFGAVNDFGGLLLTVVVAFAGITLSFPIGIVMALARRSTFPLIRPVAVGYIELIRGVPLITLLFMGQFGIRFFFPPGLQDNVPGEVARAIIMITLFSGAYVAEIIRGGLQSVDSGQVEGGQAVGLPPLKVTRLIVLPQALRNSIPALIGQFISLFKDTSLLIIIGLRDMLGASAPILANPDFANQKYTPEVYAFIGAIYWVVCFSMSRASQRLETRLGVGTR